MHCGHWQTETPEAERRGRALFSARLKSALEKGKHNGHWLSDDERLIADAMVELHNLRKTVNEPLSQELKNEF